MCIAGICMCSSAMICLNNYFVAVSAVSVLFFSLLVRIMYVKKYIKNGYYNFIISALMLVSQSWQIYFLRWKIAHQDDNRMNLL